ncbi:fimbrial protein [Enterobacter quasiroggenkampii]|uniref:fimbrial protein n=1 Tax=Enterobacter quasiroggenkampii TaxID=2497436 RepID=UPI00237AD10E|nr:fimbrial protein [Enterobacter quasiroggenkampii]
MTRKTDVAYLSGVSLLALAGLAALALSGPARADDPKNLEFKGVLVTPPSCSISNDGTVMTDFGDRVGVRRVASGIYRQEIEGLTLDCGENGSAWQLMLTVTGNAAGFDADSATVVTPEQADLGVKLLRDGQPFALGTAMKVNAGGLPKLEAQLVQRPGSELTEGAFTAQATLRAEYQ